MATSTAPTRLVNGTELPVPGTWIVDRDHAEVGFIGKHFVFTKVRGRFIDVDATVTIGEDPQDAQIIATIQTASIASGSEQRDEHLRSADLLDVEQHPTAEFRSTSVVWDGTTGTLQGDLTLVGRTAPVTLAVTFHGAGVDPWDNQRAVFEAHGAIDRGDWGLTWNMALEAGGVMVSRQIELEFHVELLRQ